MKSWEKEILQNQIQNEEAVLKKLRGRYRGAIDEVKEKIEVLKAKEQTQSVIYQIKYQEQLKKELTHIYSKMYKNMYDDVDSYLKDCYEDGFYSTLYGLHQQNIPLVFPMNQKAAAQMAGKTSDGIKLSKKIYQNQPTMVNAVRDEITKGIAMNSSYLDIARKIEKKSEASVSQAYRIARTEGHRIQNEVNFKTLHDAKKRGADIVKQWDATMDSSTRESHAKVDGEIRELDETFSNGLMFPGDPSGGAAEVINCRCALLQRARWALDEDELKTLQERAEFFGLDKTNDFDDFKKKYIKAVKTDPFEGKVFHMAPDGTLIEGEMPGATKYAQNGLTGEVTVLEDGKHYNESVWTLNEDGTFFEGKAKYQAQYKLNLDNEKVLALDATDYIKNNPNFIDDFGNEYKLHALDGSLPKELKDEVMDELLAFNGAAKYEDVVYDVIKKHGYEGIYITSTQDKLDDFIKVFDDSLIKKTKKSKLETLQTNLKTQTKKLAKIDNKTYSGIWKDDVTVSDYASKKASIQAKRDYYKDQIASGKLTDVQIKQFTKYLDDLDEFEALGKQYAEINSKIQAIKADITKFSPKTLVSSGPSIGGEAFTQARKDKAYWFTDSNGSTRAADAVLRDKSGEVWRTAVTDEKNAIYDYTQSYHKFNEPLRGIEYGTNKYLGVGNVDLNQIGVNGYGYKVGQVKKEIDAMTDIIEKSSYDFDIWVNRGTGLNGMDKFFGIDPSDFYLSESELAAKLVGTTPTEYGFMSTGVAKGKGFSGAIKMNIYCPEGTKMMYAEPFSAFGNGAGKHWDGISTQSYFGSEAEMILQRGTQFRVTKVEKSGSIWYIDMDVIGQSH